MAPGGRKRNAPVEEQNSQEPLVSPKRRAPNTAAKGRGGKAQSLVPNNKQQPNPQSLKNSGNAALSVALPSTTPKNAAYIDLCQGRPKPCVVPAHDFPRFATADVAIILSEDRKYNYQLHSAILSKNSKWFQETLVREVEEFDEALAKEIKSRGGLSHRYELEHQPASGLWLLIKKSLTMPKEVSGNNTSIGDTPVMTGDKHAAAQTTPDTAKQTTSFSDIIDAEAARNPAPTPANEKSGDDPRAKKQEVESDIVKQELEETKDAIEMDSEPSKNTGNEKNTLNKFSETKKESAATEQVTILNTAAREKAQALQAYHNMFLVFYDKSPEIDAKNIEQALFQVELLLNIARHYGSVAAVRGSINGILTLYGRELCKAIQRDPPRWLYVSLLLQSAFIFKEAIIHIVGNLPHWPWETIPQSYFKPEIQRILSKKVMELQFMRWKINDSLFMSTLLVDGKEVRLNKNNKSVLNTWVTVQLWRDWFCRSLNRPKASQHFKNIDARMYRTMAKGGDAYLSLKEVQTWLEEYKVGTLDYAQWDSLELEEDLRIMKTYAQKEVQALIVNQSMLGVEEEGIEYLTCTKVENDELPWVKKVATPAP